MPSTWQLQTDRLRLRPYRPNDVTPMRAVFGDPEVMRFSQSGGDKSLEETAARVQKLIDHQTKFGFSLWVVEDRATGAILGDCGLKQLEDGPEIEVGYRFAKAHWGRGYATEAAAASVEYGFIKLELSRIVAVVDPVNVASCRVIEKIGLPYQHRAHYYGRQLNYYAADRERYLSGRPST
jgi:[ribosomal protein S5]-alanine N-acetyltransferase